MERKQAELESNGAHFVHPLGDLENAAKKLMASVGESAKAQVPWSINQAETRTRGDVQNIARYIQDWVSRGVFKWRALDNYRGDCKFLAALPFKEKFCLERNPLRCGIIEYTSLMLLNEKGQWLERNSQPGMLLAHIYNAGQTWILSSDAELQNTSAVDPQIAWKTLSRSSF